MAHSVYRKVLSGCESQLVINVSIGDILEKSISSIDKGLKVLNELKMFQLLKVIGNFKRYKCLPYPFS